MKTILKMFSVLLLLVLSSNMTMAQVTPCPTPGKCTVFIWMNGILGESLAGNGQTAEQNWADKVKNTFGPTYLAAHTNQLDPALVNMQFDSVFNHGGVTLYSTGGAIDLGQSLYQLDMLSNGQVDLTDPDFVALLNMIHAYASQGYKVVLVGHSQGTLYMDLAYQGIQDEVVGGYVPEITALPDNSKLEIVNIASPASLVPDGNDMYTTQCDDIIYTAVLNSLIPNVNNSGVICPAIPVLSGSPDLHQLDSGPTPYLAPGSQTQKQIYADMDLTLGLSDPACNGNVSCFLSDNFGGDYITNWRQTSDMSLLETGSMITESSGTLRLTSYNSYNPALTGPGIAPAPARLTLRSRRVFTGLFTASLIYNSFGTTGTNNINLVSSATNAVVGYWSLAATPVNSTWNTISYTKTATQINLYVNGVLQPGSFPLSAMDGYYLEFDLQGNNTLQIQNLSVVQGTIVPQPPAMTLTPASNTLSVVQGSPVTANLTLTSQNGMTGNPNITLYCSGSCPTGFAYSYTSGSTQTLPVNGTIPISATFTPSSLSPPGISNFEYSVVLNGVTVTATIAINVTAPSSMTLTPASNTLSVVQGNSVTANLTLASQNGMTGTATIQPHCLSSSCPTGFTYNYLTSVSLPANGTVPLSMTFYTTTAATPGTYNFNYQVTLNGTTVTSTIAVVVTAAPTMTLTPASNTLSVVQGNSVTANLTLASQNGMTGTATIQPHCLGSSCPTGFTYNYATSTTLPANGTVPLSMTFNTTTAAAPGTYNFNYQVTLNSQTVTSTISVVVTAAPVNTGTVTISTTNNIAVSCSLNGVAVTAPATLTSQTVGTKSLSCSAPSGYTLTSISPTSQTLVAGGTASFIVTLTAVPQVGTVVVMTNGTVPSVSCVLNGVSITGPATFSNQAVGTKTLSCTPPTGFTLTSITPSTTQTLSAGGTISYTVNLTAILSPFSISCSLSPNPVTVGQTVIGTISQSGGVAPITYTQNGANLGLSNMFSYSTPSPGPITAQVTATDAGGRVASSSCSDTVVAPPFSISCSLSPNPARVGQTVTGTISQSGGIAPITYTQNGANLGLSNMFTYSTPSPGSITAQVTATDAGGRVASFSCSDTVTN